jgi:circadian clock protein KaiB
LIDFAVTHRPVLFKGLALFTPGGDLVYCIDPTKRHHWHAQLCASLQEWLNLPEIPLFLSPCYTAAVDCWFDPATQSIRVLAEAYPLIWRYQPILNTIFGLGDLDWQPIAQPMGQCDPLILQAYRQQFPQLWQSHNLVLKVDQPQSGSYVNPLSRVQSAPVIAAVPITASQPLPAATQGYSLRLFVAGHNAITERILQGLHTRLAELLTQPYTLKVIDVLKQPDQAEADQVLATPTLVKAWPQPVRRLVGDLDNPEKLGRLLMSDQDPTLENN